MDVRHKLVETIEIARLRNDLEPFERRLTAFVAPVLNEQQQQGPEDCH